MNLFVWKIWLAMKLILCFAILFAIYLLDATAAPAIDDQQNEQNHIDVLSLNSMSDFDGQRHIELQRRKRHSNDRNDFVGLAREEIANPETKKKKHPPPEKPAPEHSKPPPKEPAKQPPPKVDPPKQPPPKVDPPKQPDAYEEVPVHHYYQLIDNHEHQPYYYHHFQQHPHHVPPPAFSEPFGGYRAADEGHNVGSTLNEYQPPSFDYAQPPTGCPQNVVLGCGTPIVELVPCSGGESHPYVEELAPPSEVYSPQPEAPSYREDLLETHDVGVVPTFVASQQPIADVPKQSDAKSIVPIKQSGMMPVDKSTHNTNANLIDADVKEVIIHADTTSTTTEKIIESKTIPVPTKNPKKTLTEKKMNDMREMAKKMKELTPPKIEQLPQTQISKAQPEMSRLAMPFQTIDSSQMMPQSQQHMVGAPQMIGSNSAGGSPTQAMYYQNYQYV